MPRSNVIAMAASLLRRTGILDHAGVTFAGKRDLFEVLGYKTKLDMNDYVNRYNRGGIAKRIVDAPAKATWRLPPNVLEIKESSDETAFEKEFKLLAQRLKLYHYIERVDKLASLGRFAIMVIGAMPSDLATPLRKVRKPEDILFLNVFSEAHVEILNLSNNASDPRFGLPENYKVDLTSDLVETRRTSLKNKDVKVHYSRVIHIAESLLENDLFGRPRLQAIWNLLDDLDKVTGGAGESYWLIANRGLHLNLNDDTELTEPAEKAIEDEVAEYQHGLRRMMLTRGMELKQLGGADVDPRGVSDVLISLIAGTSEIPKRILLGSESAELASTQDRANWNERVFERQQSYGGPMVLRPIIDRFIDLGALPKPENGYTIEWPDLSALTKREQAEVALRMGAAVRNFKEQDIVSVEEIRGILGLPLKRSE